MLRRNCILSPKQLLGWFLSLSAVSLLIAGVFFLWRGVWMILPFAAIEIAALGCAFICHARHAADFERIVSEPGRLRIEAHLGQDVRVSEYAASWVRVEYRGGWRAPIRLVAGREAIEVGRFVPDHRKPALVRQLRDALVPVA